ncbi:hypothetical protein SmJEL517_g02984 [Synchytrium microbalum]|uniref:Protein kinase domain-containing protein n=1 Tax=Synchytrium microbalum TaxID=1806994 RepID=A0A507C8L9_9FUNG|nr:uncharacterized protein SmJEL517_g02984 [Synchytrium microbalum]TPX34324.1 hypothetical protein SmJEL517_g02984 [Synchytrium microbalum]
MPTHMAASRLSTGTRPTKSSSAASSDENRSRSARIASSNGRNGADTLALLGRPNPHREANRMLGGLDPSMSGSKDLSGQTKPRIEHHRCDDRAEMEAKYRIGRKLGSGAFGTVRLLEDRDTSVVYACKAVDKPAVGHASAYEQLQREVAIMKAVYHPSIVQLREVYETKKKVFLVMEYCQGGELVSKIRARRHCPESDVRTIVRRLSDAVAYLHEYGIVHRDLKPENILISMEDPSIEHNIKVSDFGLATYADACGTMDNVVGTPFYMAPEIVQNLGYTAQCDIWSIGVMTYLLLLGYTPEAEMMLHDMIANGKIEYPARLWKGVSPGARNLCECMLKFDPASRITAREVLIHPWIASTLDMTSDSPFSTTVLDLMRSFNAHTRLQRVLLIVRAAVRFRLLPKIRRRDFFDRDTIVAEPEQDYINDEWEGERTDVLEEQSRRPRRFDKSSQSVEVLADRGSKKRDIVTASASSVSRLSRHVQNSRSSELEQTWSDSQDMSSSNRSVDLPRTESYRSRSSASSASNLDSSNCTLDHPPLGRKVSTGSSINIYNTSHPEPRTDNHSARSRKASDARTTERNASSTKQLPVSSPTRATRRNTISKPVTPPKPVEMIRPRSKTLSNIPPPLDGFKPDSPPSKPSSPTAANDTPPRRKNSSEATSDTPPRTMRKNSIETTNDIPQRPIIRKNSIETPVTKVSPTARRQRSNTLK